MKYEPKMLPTVKALLELHKGNWRQVAEDTGVNYKTIRNIMDGSSKEPKVNAVETLHHYLTKKAAA